VEKVKGTSYAATIVAGVAALVLAGNPGLKPQDVQAVLAHSAHLVPATGPTPAVRRVDALAAVREAKSSR
jgi:subtilisin family serine protease